MKLQFPVDKSLSKKLAYVAKSTEDTLHRNNVSIQALKYTIEHSKRGNLLALKTYITECSQELEQSFSNHLVELYLQFIDQHLKRKPSH